MILNAVHGKECPEDDEKEPNIDAIEEALENGKSKQGESFLNEVTDDGSPSKGLTRRQPYLYKGLCEWTRSL